MNIRPDTWMPMFWGDYARDTAHLDATMHGAYLMLIKHYWCTGGPLPDDDAQLWRVACCNSLPAWKKIRPIIERFFTVADGMWMHKRVEHEFRAAEKRSEAKSRAGAKGAAKRWQAHGSAIAEPSICQNQTDTQSQSQSQSQSTKEKESSAAAASADPDLIWEGNYGRRVKKRLWEDWRKAFPNLTEAALRRELMKADAYYDGAEAKWIFKFASWLEKADKDAAEAKKPAVRRSF